MIEWLMELWTIVHALLLTAGFIAALAGIGTVVERCKSE